MSDPGRVLLVAADSSERLSLRRALTGDKHVLFEADSTDKAKNLLHEKVDVVICALPAGTSGGLDLLQHWKKRGSNACFILVIDAQPTQAVVHAMKQGAFDCLDRPVNPEELSLIVRRAIDTLRKDREIENLRKRLDEHFSLDQIVGQSKQMKDVLGRIERAAPVDSTVLILGESGTGKELVAQALHHNSPRRDGPFVAVNCAAVPATLVESELFGHVRGAFTGATERRVGRFEQADGGTLFIDEIGDFDITLQVKLLRVLETLTVTPVGGFEERKVNVRVLAATSRDIRKMVDERTFREDLYYRLNVVNIQIPPLRDRPDDIPLLVDHFLKEIVRQKLTKPRAISPEVLRRFQKYPWPGNARELRNTLESMLVLGQSQTLTELDLPERILATAPMPAVKTDLLGELTLDQLERMAIVKVLDSFKGNRTRTAAKLGISIKTLQRRLNQYGIRRRSRAFYTGLLESDST